MTYEMMKRIIQRGGCDKESTMKKLDAFLWADRITEEQYKELVELLKEE